MATFFIPQIFIPRISTQHLNLKILLWVLHIRAYLFIFDLYFEKHVKCLKTYFAYPYGFWKPTVVKSVAYSITVAVVRVWDVLWVVVVFKVLQLGFQFIRRFFFNCIYWSLPAESSCCHDDRSENAKTQQHWFHVGKMRAQGDRDNVVWKKAIEHWISWAGVKAFISRKRNFHSLSMRVAGLWLCATRI